MSTICLSKELFETKVIKHRGVAMVDFFAEWCMPCKSLSPIIEELSKELDERYIIAKINIDENPEIALKYSIISIPSVIIFKDGKEIDRLIGVRSKDDYKEAIGQITEE